MSDRAKGLSHLLVRLFIIGLLGGSCLRATALDGQFDNQGSVLIARRDMPNEKVTLAGLMLNGTGLEKVASVSIRNMADRLVVDFHDSRNQVVVSEKFTTAGHGLTNLKGAISFKQVFSSTNESGRVTLSIAYLMRLDEVGRLIVETTLNYKTKRLFFSTSGKDRGVYAFPRLK